MGRLCKQLITDNKNRGICAPTYESLTPIRSPVFNWSDISAP